MPSAISRAGVDADADVDLQPELAPKVHAGRLPACEDVLALSATELGEEVKAISGPASTSAGSSPSSFSARPERYRRAAQLLHGAFEVEKAAEHEFAGPDPPGDDNAATPLVRTSSAPPAQPRRMISEASTGYILSAPDPKFAANRSAVTLTPRIPCRQVPANIPQRMRWSFSDAQVVPSQHITVQVAPGMTAQHWVASPQNAISNSSWTPGVQAAWRSPRRSQPTSACSTPQGPFAPPFPLKPVSENGPTGRPSLSGSGTTPPNPPSVPTPQRSFCPPQPPQPASQPLLAPFPKMPGVRSTVGAPPVSRPPSYTPTVQPASAPSPAQPPAPAVRMPGPQPVMGSVEHPMAAQARQSLGRRMWRSGNGKAIGPPSPHHEKDDNLTSVCVKLQHKLGKLSTKKTISL